MKWFKWVFGLIVAVASFFAWQVLVVILSSILKEGKMAAEFAAALILVISMSFGWVLAYAYKQKAGQQKKLAEKYWNAIMELSKYGSVESGRSYYAFEDLAKQTHDEILAAHLKAAQERFRSTIMSYQGRNRLIPVLAQAIKDLWDSKGKDASELAKTCMRVRRHLSKVFLDVAEGSEEERQLAFAGVNLRDPEGFQDAHDEADGH